MNKEKKHPPDAARKSDEINRVVTLSLPDSTLQLLETIKRDLTQAIVKLTDIATKKAFPKGSSFEVVKVAPRKSVFIVGTNTKLTQIPWIKLVEVSPGRNLITIPSGISLELLEVAILELIESLSPDEAEDRVLLNEFSKYVGGLRRHNKVSRVEIVIVDS